ncbi:decaprenyl-phosphate phosphoribosyltransferase [Nonomuraea sp. NBC_01738]|uniref:decaprenyl-phosphate phosphoribosyltransferase n=1 Tax=Nonomuraea sp. NBC_01738 TaxID=2976003 RepID=UPI002E12D2A4|nr:decaprenyl-phosphate phosphoribosyltransferase [Nonomuraea sp. NBC_01738]
MSQGSVIARPSAAAPFLALFRAARPRHWLKNLLVLAAPLAAGVLADPPRLGAALLAVVAFCLAASGAYLLNDASDAAADRLHPRKRARPIAAGAVSVRLARITGVTLLLLAPGVAAITGGWRLPAVVTGYAALTLAYTAWLKHVEVVDLVAVMGCHVIRAYAGAVAVAVPVTGWFLVVVSLAALQLVAAKREAELKNTGGGSRSTLTLYTPAYLAQVRIMCSGAIVVTYCLWALNAHANLFFGLSILPLLLMVLRHNLLVERGAGEEPEELALRDRPMRVFALALVALVGLGIYT